MRVRLTILPAILFVVVLAFGLLPSAALAKPDTLILRKIRGVANGSQLPAQVRQV